MKIYKRYLDITPQQEMHLQVDHYLEPVNDLPSLLDVKGILLDFMKLTIEEADLPDELSCKAFDKRIEDAAKSVMVYLSNYGWCNPENRE